MSEPVVCPCEKCAQEWKRKYMPEDFLSTPYFTVCPICGNKRCPKGTDHDLECTGSNETGKKGRVGKIASKSERNPFSPL